jgi:hypothetical protein
MSVLWGLWGVGFWLLKHYWASIHPIFIIGIIVIGVFVGFIFFMFTVSYDDGDLYAERHKFLNWKTTQYESHDDCDVVPVMSDSVRARIELSKCAERIRTHSKRTKILFTSINQLARRGFSVFISKDADIVVMLTYDLMNTVSFEDSLNMIVSAIESEFKYEAKENGDNVKSYFKVKE